MTDTDDAGREVREKAWRRLIDDGGRHRDRALRSRRASPAARTRERGRVRSRGRVRERCRVRERGRSRQARWERA
ncbi:hypothetical protein SSP531S_07150 [Streptomyces spongiicola]|uniref:Uncharacterized protein n=1 Tax=Streptomyces spongiicola TaxID=1690221 RepID=A0A388SU48_9ACTN|nr:hypothetical protein SSP531S_07150 [Streptomyces spongiicola]